MKSTCWDTRATDSIIKNGQDTEASMSTLAMESGNVFNLQDFEQNEIPLMHF